MALEPRHPSWFTEAVSELLATFHIARAAADPARVPDAALPAGWPGLRYYRLHGSPRIYYSPYEHQYLADLAGAIRSQAPTTDTWVIFDNTASGAALHNALDLHTLVAPRRVD